MSYIVGGKLTGRPSRNCPESGRHYAFTAKVQMRQIVNFTKNIDKVYYIGRKNKYVDLSRFGHPEPQNGWKEIVHVAMRNTALWPIL